MHCTGEHTLCQEKEDSPSTQIPPLLQLSPSFQLSNYSKNINLLPRTYSLLNQPNSLCQCLENTCLLWLRKPVVQSPLSLCLSYFLLIINSRSHLSTSNLALYPWLFFNARLEVAWCEISIFMIRMGGSFSKWMSIKSCKFPCSTTGQGARTVIILIYVSTYIHGQWLVHVNQTETSINIAQPKQVLKSNHHT